MDRGELRVLASNTSSPIACRQSRAVGLFAILSLSRTNLLSISRLCTAQLAEFQRSSSNTQRLTGFPFYPLLFTYQCTTLFNF